MWHKNNFNGMETLLFVSNTWGVTGIHVSVDVNMSRFINHYLLVFGKATATSYDGLFTQFSSDSFLKHEKSNTPVEWKVNV